MADEIVLKELTAALAPDRLRKLAGQRSFERGQDYFDDGAVQSLRATGDGLRAKVHGTYMYKVRLWLEDGALRHVCTCPVGQEGLFCKHCVAVGLACGADSDEAGRAGEDCAGAGEAADVRAYLLTLDREELVSLLIDQAEEDERLGRKLTLRAARATGPTRDVPAWKTAFAEAVTIDDYGEFHDAYDHAGGIEDIIGSLDDMLEEGRADDVVELAEHGILELEGARDEFDDSSGWMTMLRERLEALHLEACRRAQPDPEALAERLFELEMEFCDDAFYGTLGTYAEVLGEAGRAAFRRRAEAAWAKVRPLEPNDDDPNRYGTRWRLSGMMEDFARADGDVDALVSVLSRDLSDDGRFLRIAEALQEAGAAERALDWAERGWKAFPGPRRNPSLRQWLAHAYHGAGRHDEAMALIWEEFEAFPYLDAYKDLRKHAKRAKAWPEWRNRALSLIRGHIDAAGTGARPQGLWYRASFDDRSVLVEIFLHEGDVEAGWQEARAGGCSPDLWLALAKRREESHPEQSIEIYRKRVASLLEHTGGQVYEEAVRLLDRIQHLSLGLGEDEAFLDLVSRLRTEQRRKRNLMKLFDARGW